MKKLLWITLMVSWFIVLPTSNTIAQSTPEELETQKRLNEVESKRTTASATTSAKANSNDIAYIEGTVTHTSSPTILISTSQGNRTIFTTDSTKFINLDSKGKRLIGFSDVKIGETISVIGLSRDSTSGTAKLIIRDQNQKPKYFSLFGQNQEVKDSILNLKSVSATPVSTKVALETTTILKSGTKVIAIEELKVEKKLVSTGTIDEKGNLRATELLLIQ